ncbi:MAG: hypothetical protein ACU0DI_04320 [Paracoccaceae bacterium]
MMKRLMIAVSAALFSATMAFAEIDTDGLVLQLQAQGYTTIDIKIGLTQVKIEAIQGDTKLEAIYDRETAPF